MGVPSSAGPERPDAARRSIRFSFAARVIVPTAGLVLLWGLAVSATLAGHGFSSLTPRELTRLMLLAGGGLVVVLAAIILMGSFARRLSQDVSGLAVTARHLADQQLPQFVERLRDGEQAAETDEDSQRPHIKTAEIAEAVAAIASLQHTAVAAAAGEAKLRDGLKQVFVSLARRNQSLLQRQLRLIDALEQKASDPAALADLFSLDHLTTRMRRHAESLTILSGAAPGRSWSEPVPVIDVIRGATAEVEDYKRVTVLTRAEDAVVGSAVTDMIHLLAELIENATLFSPSDTRVEIRAERVANGFAIEIDDRGLGIEFDQLNEINQQLTTPPDFDLANADRLGLFVGGKLAARHGVRVSLRPSPYGGITAIVLMPSSIVVPIAQTGAGPRPDARLATGRPAGLDLRSAEAPALTGPRSPQPALSPAGQSGTAPDNFSRAGQSGTAPDNFSRAGQSGTAPDNFSRVGQPGTAPDPFSGAGQPGTAPDSFSRAGQRTADTYRGLPRRTRQANLSPHLRDSPPPAAHSPGADAIPAPSDAYTPEHARDLAASLQSGWQRGRQTDTPDAQPTIAPPTAGRQDSEVPRDEEP